MPEHPSVRFDFVPPQPGGSSESRWLRVEQVQPESEMAGMDEAARLIDSLFNVDPCTTGDMGTGGGAVATDELGEPTDMPSEEEFAAAAQRELDLSFCKDDKFWCAEVDVLRSHQSPGYALRSDSAKIGRAVVIQKTVTEIIDLQGAGSVDLKWPYLSGLEVSGTVVQATVRGSTVNFAEPVTGHLRLSYQTVFERVSIEVPQEASDSGNGQMEAQAASVIAFWAEFAAACDITQPPQDDSLDEVEIARLCRGPAYHYELGGPKECFETVEHYSKCNCSKKRTASWREVVPAPCPEGVAPGTHYLGMRDQFEGYVYCEGEEDDVHDPEFYEEKCCTPPPWPLPRCRKTYSIWRGGAGIDGGPQRWIDMYGPGTRLIPVSPPDGICGELVIEWAVDEKNCCDDLAPPEIEGENIVVAPGSQVLIRATNYTSRGKWYSDKLNVLEQSADSAIFRAPGNFCGMALVQITDACGRIATRKIRSTAGKWIPHPLADICDPALYGGAMPQGEAINIGIRDDIKVEFAAELCGPEGTGYADYFCPRKPTCFSPGGGGHHEFVCWQNIGRRDQGVIGYMDRFLSRICG